MGSLRFSLSKISGLVVLCILLTSSIAWAVQAAGYSEAAASVWTSPEDISLPSSDGNDLFGTLICDPAQNLHILWGKSRDSGSEIWYRTDVGGTLSPPLDVLAMSDPLAVRLSATINEVHSTLHVIWQTSYIRGAIYYSSVVLAEAGNSRAWETPRVLVWDVDSAGISVDNTGGLHLVYGISDSGGHWNAVYHMQSDDNGLTWGEPRLVYEVVSKTPSTIGGSAAIDAAGRFHVGITIRSQEYGVYSEVGYMRSLDSGQTWGPYQIIAAQSEATPNVSGIAIFVFGTDEVHLTWHDPRRMHMWSNDGGNKWGNPVEIIQLGAGFGGANYLAKDSAGVLYVVTGVANGIYVSAFSGSQWLTPERIESRHMDPHGQQLVVCQGNQLHVIYDDRVVEDTTIWYSHKQVNAPHIDQSRIPISTARSTTESTFSESYNALQTVGSVVTAEPMYLLTDLQPPVMFSRVLTPLLTSTALVVVLISVALIWRRWHK